MIRSTSCPDSPISFEDWKNLRVGDVIVETSGREWKVLRNVGGGNVGCDVLFDSPYLDEDRATMTSMFGGRHIVIEDDAIVPELHDPGVRIKKA